MLQRMCSTFKPFETSFIECWNNGLSCDRKKSLGNYFCVTLQALKMSLKWPPLTFRVITLQDNIRLWFVRKIDESALNKVQNVKEYHFNPYLFFSEKWKVRECFELCKRQLQNIKHGEHLSTQQPQDIQWLTELTDSVESFLWIRFITCAQAIGRGTSHNLRRVFFFFYLCPGHRPRAQVIICVGFFFVLCFLR